MKNEYIYKILTYSEFENLKGNDYFFGTEKDVKDGFIHFSKKEQLIGTLKKYFKNQRELILLKVSIIDLKNLKWEQSSDGQIFPHLYSKLNCKKIIENFKIIENKDGSFTVPSYC